MKNNHKILGSVGLAAAMLVAMPGGKTEAATANGVVEVKANKVNLVSDDNANAHVIRTLEKGSKWKSYSESNGYYNLGGSQWVSANPNETVFVSNQPQNAAKIEKLSGMVTVSVDNLNLRTNSNLQSDVVRKLKKGDRYKTYGKANGMYLLGGGVWVSADSRYTSFAPFSTQIANKPANPTPATPAPAKQTTNVQKMSGYIAVKVDGLNLRSDSNFSSHVVRALGKGEIYKVYGKANGMYLLGGGVWVSASPTYTAYSQSRSALQSYAAPVVKSETPTSSVANASQIISYAKQFMGLRYVWSSSSPSNGGFDCSGFIYYVFKNNGYNISRQNVEGYWNSVQRVSTPQVGDLVFYKNTYRVGPSHMGIYLGDNKFLNAGSSHGVSIGDMNNTYWKTRLLGYGRFN